jgi:phenylacetate-coenzyme A ligase PaaK-like adenylate-forming protein
LGGDAFILSTFAVMINTNDIFNISTESEFEAMALKIFKFQFENNTVYRSFCDLLYVHPSDVKTITDIPFLPIQLFKSHQIISNHNAIEKTFSSSGTTGPMTSKHRVTDLEIYKESFRKGFKHFYGPIEEYTILALLPSYLERDGSSLIYMANDFIQKSKKPQSGFYLHNLEELSQNLQELDKNNEKVLLIGVSFALLDLVENYNFK